MNLLRKYKWFIINTVIVFIISLIFTFSGDDWQLLGKYTMYLNAIVTFIFLIFTITITILIYCNKKNFIRNIMPIIIIIIGLVLPLLVVTPIGARNFFMI